MKLSIKWWAEKMASKTFIQIPSNVDNPATLRRFLAELVLRLDIAFGNRAQSPFVSTSSLDEVHTTLDTVHATLDTVHATLNDATTTLGAVHEKVATLQTLLDVYSEGFNQSAQDDLDFPAAPTIDSSYNKAQIQQLANNVTVLANKIDSLLVVLRNAKIISV